MTSGGIEVNYFASILLLLDTKFGNDSWTHLSLYSHEKKENTRKGKVWKVSDDASKIAMTAYKRSSKIFLEVWKNGV